MDCSALAPQIGGLGSEVWSYLILLLLPLSSSTLQEVIALLKIWKMQMPGKRRKYSQKTQGEVLYISVCVLTVGFIFSKPFIVFVWGNRLHLYWFSVVHFCRNGESLEEFFMSAWFNVFAPPPLSPLRNISVPICWVSTKLYTHSHPDSEGFGFTCQCRSSFQP